MPPSYENHCNRDDCHPYGCGHVDGNWCPHHWNPGRFNSSPASYPGVWWSRTDIHCSRIMRGSGVCKGQAPQGEGSTGAWPTTGSWGKGSGILWLPGIILYRIQHIWKWSFLSALKIPANGHRMLDFTKNVVVKSWGGCLLCIMCADSAWDRLDTVRYR